MIQFSKLDLNQHQLSCSAKIGMLQRRRGRLLKQLCSFADQIKTIDIEIKELKGCEKEKQRLARPEETSSSQRSEPGVGI
jgi:hypothetical protein